MTAFIPNDTVDVLRTVIPAKNEYEDPIDTDDVLVADVPVHISDAHLRTYDPVSGQVTVFNQYVIRLRPSNDYALLTTDRLLSNRTGKIFSVDQINENFSPLQRSDIVVSAKWVGPQDS